MSEKENQMIANKFKRERQRMLKQFVFYEKEVREETESFSKQSELLKELEELNRLFDSVLAELEERQTFLESLDGLDSATLEQQTKHEMTARLAELRKITRMIAQVKREMEKADNSKGSSAST